MKLFKKRKTAWVAFCERCGEVCDRRCRADAVRERASRQVTSVGPRI